MVKVVFVMVLFVGLLIAPLVGVASLIGDTEDKLGNFKENQFE